MTKMDHATVKIDNWDIPLIGIPQYGVREKCDKCKKECHIQDITLTETMFLCKVCQDEK